MFEELVRLARKCVLRWGTQRMIARTLRKMGVRLGERCRIYATQWGSEPWLISIGDHCHICAGVQFLNHELNYPFQDKYESLTGFGTIVIKDNCQIGPSSLLLPGITIGPNAIVGAGSVVTKDVPPDTVVAGNPAKVLCTLAEYEAKCLENHIPIPNDRSEARRILEKRFWGGE